MSSIPIQFFFPFYAPHPYHSSSYNFEAVSIDGNILFEMKPETLKIGDFLFNDLNFEPLVFCLPCGKENMHSFLFAEYSQPKLLLSVLYIS